MNTNPAVFWGTRRITWGQLEQYCASVIGQLKGLGLKAGDRVAICAPTSTEYIIVLFALWRMKVIVCPVSPRWPVKTVSEYLAHINASLLLTAVQLKNTLHTVPVRALNLNEVVCFDARRDVPGGGKPWQADLQQETTIIATSGSSGFPKAAVHTWANHYYSALGSNEIIPLTVGDRWLLSLPLYHVSGIAIVVRCFVAGAAIVIAGEDDLAQTIIKRQITHVSLVTTQLYRLLQTPAGVEALKSLKYILLGGSAIAPLLIEKCLAQGFNVYVSYGLTEMSSQVATGKAGGCVKILPHRQLKLSGEGEVLVKGETLFKGYIQSGRIHLPLTPEGWFKTGDLGRLDDQGCLTVIGRKDRMFISGGENIHPEEIEKVLLSLEGIVQAKVEPKEDAEFGRRPVAFIKFDRQPIADQVLGEYCNKSLPRFKIPVAFYPWSENVKIKAI